MVTLFKLIEYIELTNLTEDQKQYIEGLIFELTDKLIGLKK